jgi:hypothetical protein
MGRKQGQKRASTATDLSLRRGDKIEIPVKMRFPDFRRGLPGAGQRLAFANVGAIGAKLASYLCVGFLQFVLLYPLHRTMDLPKWDEAISMGQGEQFMHGGRLGPLSGTPVYALLYSAFVAVFGTVKSIFYMQYFVKIGVSLLLFFFLSMHLRSRLLALLFAMIWVVSGVNVWESVLVYHVAMGVFLLALSCLDNYPVRAILLLWLCALVRLEYLLPALAFTGYLIWKNRANGRPKVTTSQLAVTTLLAVLVLYVLLNLSDFNVGGNRTWLAFQQHYSLHQVEAGRFNVDPYIDSNIVTQTDFPGANSLTRAFLINPRFFTKHLVQNAAMLPGAVLKFVHPFATQNSPVRFLFGALAGFAVAILTLASADSKFFPALFAAVRHRKMILYATIMSMTALMPSLLVYPKPHYSLIMVPFLLFWPGLICVEALKTINNPEFTRRGLILMNVLFALGILASEKPYAASDRGRPVLAEITQLIQIWPQQRTTLMGIGSTWYASYIGSLKVSPIEPQWVEGGWIKQGSGNMYALIKQHNPDVVLINHELTASENFDTDSFAALRSSQWAQCSIGSDSFYFRAGKVNARFECFSNNPDQHPAGNQLTRP